MGWFFGAVVFVAVASVPGRSARAAEIAATKQDAPPVSRAPMFGWFAAGLGPGGIGAQGAGTGRLELVVGRGSRLLSVRYSYFEDTNGTSCDQLLCLNRSFSLPRNRDQELAVQYGVAKRLYASLLMGSLGVAGVRTLERGPHLLSTDGFLGTVSHDSTSQWTAGATVELGAYLSSRFVSFGPTLIADVNPVQPAWSLLLDLHIGWMGPSPPSTGAPPTTTNPARYSNR